MNIVIVESPAKAKTINKYLGASYEVLASFGHVRDLPAKNGSVDPEANFQMIWEVDPKAAGRLNDIAKALKGADRLILATDPDREGEAISWHVLEVLKEKRALKDQKIERVVFNAITKQAVTDAMKASAPDRRRAGRRLYGAPRAGLSGRLHALAGAVAQTAGRALGGPRAVGRAAAGLRPRTRNREIRAARILVAGRDADDAARRQRSRRAWSAPTARRSSGSTSAPAPKPKTSRRRSRARELHGFDRRSQSRRAAIRRRPSPPRRCSRKPAASSALRRRIPCGSRSGSMKASISAARPPASSPICEPTACRSTASAITQARKVIGEDYGNAYVPDAPRQYQTKAKNAQEAHEAIRPTDLSRRPAEMRRRLDTDQARLYELIWIRTIASQMESAELERTTVDIAAKAGSRVLELRATRPGDQIRRLPRALSGRPRRRRRRRGFSAASPP